MLPHMNWALLQRLCAALMVLAFLAGLPMQGTAMTSVAATSPPWSAGADGSRPDTCDRCGDQPVAGMLCPIVFCIGLSAVITKDQEPAGLVSHTASAQFKETRPGPSYAPDPYPPKASLQT